MSEPSFHSSMASPVKLGPKTAEKPKEREEMKEAPKKEVTESDLALLQSLTN